MINIRVKGAHLILPKVEWMTSAWGIVPLAPLFDGRLVQVSVQIPSRLKLVRAAEKNIIKRAYQDELPAEVIAWPISGTRVPVHHWLQGELKRCVRTNLERRAVRPAGIFDPRRGKQKMGHDTEEGPDRYGLRLWVLLTFKIWQRMMIEGECPAGCGLSSPWISCATALTAALSAPDRNCAATRAKGSGASISGCRKTGRNIGLSGISSH